MSDLAPLVAATIRDRVVMDMKAEIDELKAKVDELKEDKFRPRFIMADDNSATVTIYATADLKENNCIVMQDEAECHREYMFKNSTHDTIKTLHELNKSNVLCELFKYRDPLVAWEVGIEQFQPQDHDDDHQYYHVKTRNSQDFDVKLEFRYANNQYPDFHRRYGAGADPWRGFFYDRDGQVLDPAPMVKFQSVTLHAPLYELMQN